MTRPLRLTAAILALLTVVFAVLAACDAPGGGPTGQLPLNERNGEVSGGLKTPSESGSDFAAEGCAQSSVAVGAVTSGEFLATFDGAPQAPGAFCGVSNWDMQVHSRDASTWKSLEPMDAQHGPDCAGPPATHHLSGAYADAVFQCRDHVMTSINASGYGAIYLTPAVLLDLSKGAGTVRFDLSTLRMSTRDWIDLWVTPYEDNLALPFDQGDVDLQGLPRQGVHINMSSFNGETTFRCYQIDNFVESELEGTWWDTIDGRLKEAGRSPSANVRDTFELKLSKTRVSFASTTIPGWSACDTALAALSFDRAVVQFGHHSYNPAKDDSGQPATWHWDNVSIQPAISMPMLRAAQRAVTGPQTEITFSAGAPKRANLRFAANGAEVQVSTDGGATWEDARVQPAEFDKDRFRSYFMPIPEGVTSVRVRGEDTPNGPFFAQDFAIWGLPD